MWQDVLVAWRRQGCPWEPRWSESSSPVEAGVFFGSVRGRGGKVRRAVAAESGPYKKISVRCDSILPGLMDAWVLLGCLG